MAFGDFIPGTPNPLENVDIVATSLLSQSYYLHVVPKIYTNASTTVSSNQYSVYSVQREVGVSPFGQISALPGIFFIYDLTPFMHIITDRRMSLARFLVRCCAVIGGVAAVREGERNECVDCQNVGHCDVLQSKGLTIVCYETNKQYVLYVPS